MIAYEYLALPVHQVRAFRVAKPWRITGPRWYPEIEQLLDPGPWPWVGGEVDARTVAVLWGGLDRHVPMAVFRRLSGRPETVEARTTGCRIRTDQGWHFAFYPVFSNLLRRAA